MEILFVAIGITVGVLIGWLLAKTKLNASIQSEKENAQLKLNELEKEYVAYKATATSQLQTSNENLTVKQNEKDSLNQSFKELTAELTALIISFQL